MFEINDLILKVRAFLVLKRVGEAFKGFVRRRPERFLEQFEEIYSCKIIFSVSPNAKLYEVFKKTFRALNDT